MSKTLLHAKAPQNGYNDHATRSNHYQPQVSSCLRLSIEILHKLVRICKRLLQKKLSNVNSSALY